MTDQSVDLLKRIIADVSGMRGELAELRTGQSDLRTELRQFREEVDTRFGEVDFRLERVERRVVESEVRLATEVMQVVGALNDIRLRLADDSEVRTRVANHERRLSALERRRNK